MRRKEEKVKVHVGNVKMQHPSAPLFPGMACGTKLRRGTQTKSDRARDKSLRSVADPRTVGAASVHLCQTADGHLCGSCHSSVPSSANETSVAEPRTAAELNPVAMDVSRAWNL